MCGGMQFRFWCPWWDGKAMGNQACTSFLTRLSEMGLQPLLPGMFHVNFGFVLGGMATELPQPFEVTMKGVGGPQPAAPRSQMVHL